MRLISQSVSQSVCQPNQPSQSVSQVSQSVLPGNFGNPGNLGNLGNPGNLGNSGNPGNLGKSLNFWKSKSISQQSIGADQC